MQRRIYLWEERLLFVGPALDTELHRHHVAQIGMGLQGPVRVRTEQTDAWREAPAFFVPPDIPHAFHSGEGFSFILYLEPESRSYAAFLEQHPEAHDAEPVSLPIREDLRALATAAATGRSCEDVDHACRALWRRAQPPAATLDPRIARAAECVRAQLHGRIGLAQVARSCGMSESHLMHRFTEEMGLPFRRYVLWSRLRAAVDRALQGASLTEAAHAAGFADSGHLSRTFKQTFGITPSFLFGQMHLLDIRVCGPRPPEGATGR